MLGHSESLNHTLSIRKGAGSLGLLDTLSRARRPFDPLLLVKMGAAQVLTIVYLFRGTGAKRILGVLGLGKAGFTGLFGLFSLPGGTLSLPGGTLRLFAGIGLRLCRTSHDDVLSLGHYPLSPN